LDVGWGDRKNCSCDVCKYGKWRIGKAYLAYSSKPLGMKSILLVAVLVISYAAVAQNDPYKKYLEKRKKPLVIPMHRNNDSLVKKLSIVNDGPAAFPEAKQLMVLSNGSKVYALPQDNMPCVVPDMKQFSIPNSGSNKVRVYTYNGPGAIPNAAQTQAGNRKSVNLQSRKLQPR
jgi:hypothetical protein